ncbi:ion transporter [Actinophytocola sp. S1-96]|uniref:Ion transporter n=2 Tax=Actinophytocola gossypii TaxID=2812003 RepID=A0ABT2J0Y7_9PSEU|nr:ion transporter [Actinophytocola gossypii]
MLLLAVVSVGMLVWAWVADLRPETRDLLFTIDVGICAVFLVEFVWRWRAGGWGWRFLGRNWFEIVGMIPVSHPALRAFRLLRVIVLLARLGRAVDRTVGDAVTQRLVNRFLGSVIAVLKKPVTVAVLDEVGAVLRTGHYAKNISRALAENQTELRQLVLDKIRADPAAGRLKLLPFHDDIVGAITDTTIRVVLEMLADPRTDEMISDSLRENLDQIRAAVEARET